MTSDDKTWEAMVADYLRRVEKNLASVGYRSSKTIIEDIRAHLDQRYADLPSEKRNWEGYQETITEMGPPSDYAELLGMATLRRRVTIWRGLAIGLPLILLLLAWGVYAGVIPLGLYQGPRIYPIEGTPVPSATSEWVFESDPQLTGKWTSVDFVGRPADFSPAQQQWQGDPWMTSLDFRPDGALFIAVEGGESFRQSPWTWTRNWILNQEKSIRAQYQIKQFEDQTYLFFPWLSGDVTLRYIEPSYYVLAKTEPTISEP